MKLTIPQSPVAQKRKTWGLEMYLSCRCFPNTWGLGLVPSTGTIFLEKDFCSSQSFESFVYCAAGYGEAYKLSTQVGQEISWPHQQAAFQLLSYHSPEEQLPGCSQDAEGKSTAQHKLRPFYLRGLEGKTLTLSWWIPSLSSHFHDVPSFSVLCSLKYPAKTFRQYRSHILRSYFIS